MMADTHAYFGQPGVFPQFQPQTLVPQSLFGAPPGGQYAQALGQLIAGCLAQQQLAGQLGAVLGPTAFAPYPAFSGLTGQHVPPFGQSIGGWPGYSPPGAFPPQALYGSPQGQFGQGQFGTFPSVTGIPAAPFALPFGAGGPWLGRPHSAAGGPQGFPVLGGQSTGDISAWQPQLASQLLGAVLGRSFQQPYQFQPYQVTSPMAGVA